MHCPPQVQTLNDGLRHCGLQTILLQTVLSQPSEKVLFVPHENVLLTESRWQGGKRSPADDPERSRPVGRIEEGTEETDPAALGGRGTARHRAARAAHAGEVEADRGLQRDPRPAGPRVEPEAKRGVATESHADSLAESLPKIRTDAGQRVLEPETPAPHRPGSAAQADDRGWSVARPATAARRDSCVAAAPELARGDGAVGYLRARMAGRARTQAVFNPHDRRRHKRVDGAFCRARFDRRKYAPAVE